MADRLKEIWTGFAETTTRQLTGRGVENIVVPSQYEYADSEEETLPPELSAPADAAFAALRDRLSQHEKRFAKKKRAHEDIRADERSDFSAEHGLVADDLIRGLKATAFRTERPDHDYAAYLSTNAGKAAFKKARKKRFFGLF